MAGGSVAGKIRIDLLANVAQFKAGMREAGREGLGGFREEFDRTVKGFNTQKAISNRLDMQSGAWHAAMGDVLTANRPRGALRAPTYFGEAASAFVSPWGPEPKVDQALRNEIKAKSMLPWGNTLRSEMSREAALTAAAIGEHKQTIVKRLAGASREIFNETATAGVRAAGLGGPLGEALSVANRHPLAVAGAAVAGWEIERIRERYKLAHEVHGESLALGQSAEDTSKIRALGFDTGQMFRFQAVMAGADSPEKAAAFQKLRLDPYQLGALPLLDALERVGHAFKENVFSPIERASVARELFGKGGWETMEGLWKFDERMKLIGEQKIITNADVENAEAIEHALTRASNKLDSALSLGRLGQSGFKNIARTMELIVTPFGDYGKTIEKFRQEDIDAAASPFNEEDRQNKAAWMGRKATRAAPADMTKGAVDSLRSEALSQEQGVNVARRQKYIEDLDAAYKRIEGP